MYIPGLLMTVNGKAPSNPRNDSVTSSSAIRQAYTLIWNIYRSPGWAVPENGSPGFRPFQRSGSVSRM
jgi:hypothetical protein